MAGESYKSRDSAARRIDHASRIEASRARIVAYRKMCLNTAAIVRETNITIERTLQKLEGRVRLGGSDSRSK